MTAILANYLLHTLQIKVSQREDVFNRRCNWQVCGSDKNKIALQEKLSYQQSNKQTHCASVMIEL